MRAKLSRMVSLVAADEAIEPEGKAGELNVVGTRYDLENGASALVK